MSLLKLRGSASLIIAAKHKLMLSEKDHNYNYRILMIRRPETGTFANSNVFPGGVQDAADESAEWLTLFEQFGVPNEKLQELTKIKTPRPSIFNKSDEKTLPREISLRITALREAFEEVGLLFFRHRDSFTRDIGFQDCSEIYTLFDRPHWQHIIHNDASQFYNLCKRFSIIPDLWSLHEWSTWITPAIIKKRFKTVFYVIGLDKHPDILLDAGEVTASTWCNPGEFLRDWYREKILLPPPQLYELFRLCNFKSFVQLLRFAFQRTKDYGMIDLLPINYICRNGMCSLLPGDEMYPKNPFSVEGFVHSEKSLEEFRFKRLHRIEFASLKAKDTILLINVQASDGQILPKHVNYQNKI